MTATCARPFWLAPALTVTLTLLATPLAAQDAATGPAPTPPFDAAQEEAVRNIVRDYLLANPEVLVEALQTYQERQRLAQQEAARQALASNRELLENDPDAPVMGNPDGDVVVVEFFDYRCPYCIQVADALRREVETDGNIRLVMKEFPILGPDSVTAARMALAANRQGKYEELHWTLMNVAGKVTEDKAWKAAERVGLDLDQLRADMQAPEIDAMLQRNFQLAQQLQVNGTPAFVVGDEVVRGAIEMPHLRYLVRQVRGGSS